MSPHVLPGISLIGPAAFLKDSRTLVLADLHLGAEAAIVGAGVLLPRTQKREQFSLITQIIEREKPARIILAGDIKHEFGAIHEEEWRDVLELIDLCSRHAQLSVITGNHDRMLLPILRKRGVPMSDREVVDGWLIMHGDKRPEPSWLEEARGLIIGHEHPSLLLDDGVRKEKFKCFLAGDYQQKRLLVLPSTYPLVEGSDVLRERALGPVLSEARHLEAYVVEGLEALYFGPLEGIDNNI